MCNKIETRNLTFPKTETLTPIVSFNCRINILIILTIYYIDVNILKQMSNLVTYICTGAL